ncbi:MAG: nucleotidyltransferase family protein [Candidatus Omnitrophica bacterium]|jgi:hypothetical protein|nr:nucleotidyltransferase family protein [Candidatus Omnitrophota bacterium]
MAITNSELIKGYFRAIVQGERKGPPLALTGGPCALAKVMKYNEMLYYAILEDDLVGAGRKFPEQVVILERQTLARTFEYLNEITRIFLKNKLRFFAMKTFRSYAYVDGDIDLVLVDRKPKARYLKALVDAGFREKWNISTIRESKKRFYVKEDENNQIALPVIHVHFTVSWNGIDCLNALDVWNRLRTITINGNSIQVPSIEDELLIAAAHTLYENTYITVGELLHIKTLLAGKKDLDMEYMVKMSKRYNWYHSLKFYFKCLEASFVSLTGQELLSKDFKNKFQMEGFTRKTVRCDIIPFFMATRPLIPLYIEKALRDLGSLRLTRLPRELITFCLVIWLYRHKKIAKFKEAFLQ